VTDPGSLFNDGVDRTVFKAQAAAGTAFFETELAGFAKADLVESKQPLGAGGYAAAAAGTASGIDPGDVAKGRLQRISSSCFQVNSACCVLMVRLKG
jgi:hypothetical protein